MAGASQEVGHILLRTVIVGGISLPRPLRRGEPIVSLVTAVLPSFGEFGRGFEPGILHTFQFHTMLQSFDRHLRQTYQHDLLRQHLLYLHLLLRLRLFLCLYVSLAHVLDIGLRPISAAFSSMNWKAASWSFGMTESQMASLTACFRMPIL